MSIIEAIEYLFFIAGILSLFRPILIVYLFAALTVVSSIPTVPNDVLLKILQIGSINFYVQDYLTVIALFLVLKFAIQNRGKGEITLTSLLKLKSVRVALLLLPWSLFIGILSYMKGFQFQNVLRHFSSEFDMMLCLLIPYLMESEETKQRFFKFSLVLGCILVLFGVFRYVTNEVTYTSSGTLRTLHANTATVLLFGICYGLFYESRMRNSHFMTFILVLFLSIGIFLTGHRSGFLVLAVLLVAYFGSETLIRLEHAWVPLLGTAAVLLLVFLVQMGAISFNHNTLFAQTIKRGIDTFDMENETTRGRLERWRKAMEIAKESPLLGLGRYKVYTGHMDSLENNPHLSTFSELARGEHNVFMDKLVHEGLLGLFLIVILFFYVLKHPGGSAYDNSSHALFLRLYLASFIIYSLFNTTYSNSFGRIYFFISLGFLHAEILKGKGDVTQLKHGD